MAKPRTHATGIALIVSGCLICTHAAAQSDTAVDFYGSLRTQVESVHPDREDRLDSYAGFRDAYSRIGVTVKQPIGAHLSALGQVEVAVDSANLRLRDPYDQGDASRPQGQRFRIARIGLQGAFGSIMYGQQWMPYYNAVAAPVDMFSSYYSGYATYTVFRVANTVAYSTPSMKGLTLSAGYAGSSANARSTSRIDSRRWQATAAYAIGKTILAAGIDDRGDAGYGRNRLYGLSASHQIDKLYMALKYEIFDTGNRQRGGFSSNGNQAVNLLGSYALGSNTVKLMLAKVENYGDYIVHLGVDHHFNDKFKMFAEFYSESETAALSRRRGGLNDFDGSISGGRAFAIGIRHDF